MTTTYSPKHQVILKRAENDRKEEDISSDVVSITTQKTYGQPVGGFTIITTFKPAINGKRYNEVIKPNDIVMIRLDEGNGKGLVPVMVGLVNCCERSRTTAGDGRIMRSVSITGYDFGKILIQHYAKWYIAPTETHEGSEKTQTEVQYGATLMAGGTPDTILKRLVDAELYRVMPWTTEYILTDKIGPLQNPWSTAGVTFTMHSPMWSILRQYADEPYNKLHADTGTDGKFHIILTKCPFDDKTGKLTHQEWLELNDSDIISEQLGINDFDRINYIWHRVQSAMFGDTGKNGPLQYIKGDTVWYDDKSVVKHGFRPWYPDSGAGAAFTPFNNVQGNPVPPQLTDQGSISNIRRPVKERTDAFANWYKLNHTYESGIIKVHGKPHARAGGGVLLTDLSYEYLIEQVSHNYSVWPSPRFETSLHVTRGQKHANN